MAVLIEDSYSPQYPLNHARIGYEDVTDIYSATSGGASADLAKTWQTYERWTPDASPATLTATFSETTIDYIGIGAHTLGVTDSLVFEVQVSGSWVTIDPGVVEGMEAPDNEAIMLLMGSRSATGVRVTVTYSGEAPTIGKLSAGEALEMARPFYGGHSPIMLSRNTTRRPNVSERGEWLGTTLVRQGRQTGADWQHLKAAWYRQNFDPFVGHAQRFPFFFAWNPLQFPDCVYATLTNDVQPSNMGIRALMSVSINIRGYSDGTEPHLSIYPAEWLEFYPEATEDAEIIDVAINQEWPEA